MSLYLIGIGLNDEKDITLKGLEAVKKCDFVYLENYTSKLNTQIGYLEKLYGKKIIPAGRELVEMDAQKSILQQAKSKNVAFLVAGDVFAATTHIDMFLRAKKLGIDIKIVHNASVLTAIGITGLQLYKFGRVASLPFPEDVPRLETPYKLLQQNLYLEMHTLFLLDLKPQEGKFMGIKDGLEILERIEARKKEHLIKDDMLVVGCARLGSRSQLIKWGKWKDIKKIAFGKPPFCFIILGKLHFMEKEMLRLWR